MTLEEWIQESRNQINDFENKLILTENGKYIIEKLKLTLRIIKYLDQALGFYANVMNWDEIDAGAQTYYKHNETNEYGILPGDKARETILFIINNILLKGETK